MHQQHRVACTAVLFYPIFVLSHLSPDTSRVNNPTYIRIYVDTVRGKAGGASADSLSDALLYVLRAYVHLIAKKFPEAHAIHLIPVRPTAHRSKVAMEQ